LPSDQVFKQRERGRDAEVVRRYVVALAVGGHEWIELRFCTLPNRQRAAASINVIAIMQDLLQQLDQDYYRSALLLVARAELEQLRQMRRAGIDVKRGKKTPFRTEPTADGTASPESSNRKPPLTGLG
jgi:hypothetical protein